MKENVLVIDIGTQSLRAAILNKEGETLAFSKQKYEVPFFSPKKGYAEQDVDYYLEELSLGTKDINNRYPELLSTVRAMVMVPFRDSSVILDEKKKPIRPAILWLDQRVERMPKQENLKLYEKILFRLIGMSDTVRYNAERTPSFWLMKNEPENWKKMKYYCPLGAYFNSEVTGNLAVSTADCIGHYPINFSKAKWYSRLHPKQDVFKIPYDALPKLVKVSDLIGKVTKEFSARSMIPEGVEVYACGSDKSCETFGNGAIDETVAAISLGTACTIDVVSHRYTEPEKFLPSYPTPYGEGYDLEVQIYRGLWMINWYLDNFADNDRSEASKLGISVEDYLNEKIKEVPVGCDGLVLQPYWGPGLKRPNAKGSIVGFSGSVGRHHLYRAIFEGLAFALREGLDEIMKKTHRKPKYLLISGGGAKSDVLCQILVDVFGIDGKICNDVDSSTLGGAMSLYLDLGVYKTPQDAVKHMTKEGRLLCYDKKNHEIYDRIYHTIYLKMYPSLKNIYNSSKNCYLDSIEEKKD